MLLAAGYFRARLATLSPFDKVVGGMVWSITASGVEVGVDILFQENSTIGDRIKLSEQLVKALLYMKCPLPLQSHQIQGFTIECIYLLSVQTWGEVGGRVCLCVLDYYYASTHRFGL